MHFLCSAYKPDKWEVDAKCVVLHNVLGEGAFGKVYSGTLLDGKKELDVAVKVWMSACSLDFPCCWILISSLCLDTERWGYSSRTNSISERIVYDEVIQH